MGLVILAVVALGCGAPHGSSPLPAGIAELRLPADAVTLARMAADEDAAQRIDRRRETLAGVHRQLLMMSAPADALVPEQFDFLVALAPRIESGAIDAAWGSYLFTTYERDLARERPDGRPRRGRAEIDAVLDRWVEFYHIRANPRLAPANTAESQGFEGMRDYRDQRRMRR